MKSPARTAGEYGPRGVGTPGGVSRSIMTLVSLRFEQPLSFYCRHAAGACCRNRLPVYAILHVAGVKHARDIRPRAAVREQIAIGVEIQLALKDSGIRDMADSHE